MAKKISSNLDAILVRFRKLASSKPRSLQLCVSHNRLRLWERFSLTVKLEVNESPKSGFRL